ncbi:hypothetical protein N788_05790 [Arenimonas donghaensis DSM 18148 = HO3-R19]|uniref:Uncharacterized protein n=1 Tax=Arenimonas donghaensis DSM 18148 = HO3-R19 TaxID=1121014 RepID=A0A087MGQ3_9GAMM|nr:hypothetical protein N788_05790 [Arenimonas donghaensis DSM 18148 = HO3-R19]
MYIVVPTVDSIVQNLKKSWEKLIESRALRTKSDFLLERPITQFLECYKNA